MDDDNKDFDPRSGFMLGEWVVRPDQNRIDRGSETVQLEPKVMGVLCLIAQQQGEVVSRTALIDEVWKGTYVTDEVLSRAISVLRKQLGDDRKSPEYIVTIPKGGYRLIKPVAPIAATYSETATPSTSPASPGVPKWMIAGASVLVVFLLLLLGNALREPIPAPPIDPRSPTLFADLSEWFELIIRGNTAPEAVINVAVLPFDDISEQPGNAFLSDGLTDELISSLGQLEGLKVVARSSSLGFRQRYEDVRTIGDILQVQAVIEGTVKRSENHIRISAQLNSTEDGYVVWARTYDRDMQDFLALEAEIASEIVNALREKLELDTVSIQATSTTLPDIDAYQLYLNGRFLWKLRGEKPLRNSIKLFEQALQWDPNFVRARLGLANSLLLLPYYTDDSEEQVFERSLSLITGITDVTPAQAGEMEAIRGFIAFRRWQWQLAEDHFHKALLLAPNNPNIYLWYSQLLSSVGRNVDALKAAQQARDLDAVSPVLNHRLAVAWMWNGDNVRAAEQYARSADLGFVNLRSPGYLIFLLRMQRFEESRQVIKIMYTDAGIDPTWLMDNIEAISTFSGDENLVESAVSAVDRNEVLPRMQLGLWLYLEQSERAYGVIKEQAAQKKHVVYELLFSEEGRAFRESDEFSDMVEEFGLSPYWDSWRGPDELL
jgi:TolB-like protein/DNA-binding winged helix-turn-helix (wHTH) protein